jgi:uncharacterized membrane protein
MEFLAELHPKIIHFPIALFITSVLFDFIELIFRKESFGRSAHLLLFLGVIGGFAAALSGNQAFIAYEFWNDSSSALLEQHQLFANITIWFFAALLILRTYLVLRKKYFGAKKYLIITLAFIGCYFIYQASEYGGELVKKFGIGTEFKMNLPAKNE